MSRAFYHILFAAALFLANFPLIAVAQPPPAIPQGVNLGQLQVQQPLVDATVPVTLNAFFDPPVVQPGQKSFYRVAITATESSIQWPDEVYAPTGLNFGVNTRGQILRGSSAVFQPLTVFAYEVAAAQPGKFTVPSFNLNVYGTNEFVPQATLQVTTNPPPDMTAPRRLLLQPSLTNVYAGQPFLVSVILPAGPGGQLDMLREVQLNGTGFIVDKYNVRQMAQSISLEGNPNPVMAYMCEMNVTPAAAGHMSLSAQAFAVGGLNGFSGRIVVHGGAVILGGGGNTEHYDFLTSEPVDITVAPLPATDRPDSFTGSIGQFLIDPPHLSANRLHTGQPVSLTMGIHGEGDLTRYVPPNVPRSREWQIIAEQSPNINFTLIPRTDDVQATPAIPFSYFDPIAGQYVDATIPPQPVTVDGEGLPMTMAAENNSSNAPPRLSDFASSPGWSAPDLKPPQLRVWFVAVQFLPVLALLALLQWDRLRRFLEAHPEILRRIHARRALRREKRNWQRAVTMRDAPAFAVSAVRAMQTACAPHFPAQADALVGADIASVLDDADRSGAAGETVRKIFTAVDTRFAATHPAPPDLLALEPHAAAALAKLEEKL